MGTREGAVFAAVLSVCVQAHAQEPEAAAPRSGIGLSSAALIAAGVAAAAAALAGRGGKDDEGGGGADSRSLVYSSSADWMTPEYAAQRGLGMVNAQALYWSGHYRWYTGAAADPAAGTGVGVKIAVGDMGINAPEASTGGAIAIDARASYDYVANRAGAGADDYGHGTHVAGIIAAPRNGAGMHGLAYNATIVSFKLGDGGSITASDAQRGDMFRRAAAAGAMVINNSWSTRTSISARSGAELEAAMPGLIAGAREYVAAGGVVVFSAGNLGNGDPSLEPGLPHRISGLQPGWLAVVAVDNAGAIGSYSSRCGVAAAWCIAAPGGSLDEGLWSMQNNGGYDWMYGTSMAAPHAAAAIAALKSMFPNLSFQQLRERLLFTANRSGAYADASAYGQGLMDLGAAASPVGGVAVPTGASASGAVAPVEGSGVAFPAGTLAALGMQAHVLVVDNYQRAPFWMPAQTFFREQAPRLVERQWASLRAQPVVASGSTAGYRFGFSQGTGGEKVLGSQLALAWLPRLAAPELETVALGYATELRGTRFGLLGSFPAASTTADPTMESSPLGARRALGAVAQRSSGASTWGATLAFADGFERPIGIAATGAFGVAGGNAFSSGAFAEHAFGGATVLRASFETAHHRAESLGALDASAWSLHSASLGARTRLARGTTLSATIRREWSNDAAELRVPLTIDEQGTIGALAYSLPYEDLVGRSAVTLRLDRELSRAVALRASLTRERSGFGASLTGAAAMLVIAY